MSRALTFEHARRRHVAAERAAQALPDEAPRLWAAITGIGPDPLAGTYADAVRDTFPESLSSLLGTNAVAAAFALTAHTQPAWEAQGRKLAPIDLRDMARQAWTGVVERAETSEKLATGFGWDLSSAWEVSGDVTVRGDTMASVEAIAKMAGRMYASLRGENAKRVPATGGEIYSVEQGNNLGRLLASEQVLLTDELFEVTVLERIATRRALQYAVRGTDKASRGPLVVLIDESGSMKYDAQNQPNEAKNVWAKSAAVAMARVAKDEGRPFAVIHYSTSCKARRVDPSKPADVLEVIRHFLNGGTDTARAIVAGLDEVAALAAEGHRGADLVLMTDGTDPEHGAQQRAVDRCAVENVRLWTVAIECAIGEGSPLRTGAAGYTGLGAADLQNSNSVTGIARAT